MYRVVYQKFPAIPGPKDDEPHEIVRSDGSVVGRGATTKDASDIMLELNRVTSGEAQATLLICPLSKECKDPCTHATPHTHNINCDASGVNCAKCVLVGRS